MAGSKLMVTGRIKASSILEVLIAMVLIMIVFGIAMMISANVMRSSLSVKKIKAQALLQQVLVKAEQNTGNTNQTFTMDEFKVDMTVKTYGNSAGLTEIDLAAYDTNLDTVGKMKKVMLNK